MSTALQIAPQQGQTYMQPLSREQIDLLKDTMCKGATDSELALFVQICNRTQLDPFSRQIFAIKRWDSKLKREVMQTQTSIDGFRLSAARTGEHVGTDDVVYDTEDADYPLWASVTVYRLVKGQRAPYTAKARWNEYVQKTKDGEVTHMWRKMPYLMLGKCAEALALRKAFPAELSGLFTADEMGQAENEAPPMAKQEARQEPQKALSGVTLTSVLAGITAAVTHDELARVADVAKRLSPTDKAKAKMAYAKRHGEITAEAMRPSEIPHDPDTGEVKDDMPPFDAAEAED